jgi:hypothetical protein
MGEKTYLQCHQEITAEALYEGLLGYGLFTDKLPPLFSSVGFYNYCRAKQHQFQSKECQYIFYENTRNTNVPRSLGIPNPMAYERLCRRLADSWSDITSHFDSMTSGWSHKISRVHMRQLKGKKEIFEMNYKNWREDDSPIPDMLIGKRYLVEADISTCFPSIYTHAIPWALVRKDVAKQKRQNNLWFNEIDQCCRNMRCGETQGLLIGPHASNLISEIILTSVDKILYSNWDYIRNIDDYSCYVTSYEDGQQFLSNLNGALRAYGLLLNHKKTKISPLPTAAVESWVRKIGTPLLNEAVKRVDYKGIRSYLDTAIELASLNDNAAVLKYAIKVLCRFQLTDNAQQYYIKTILHYSFIYPYLISLLDKYVFQKHVVDKNEIENFALLAYDEALKSRNYEMASYSLYFALKYGFAIPSYCDDIIIGK